MALVGCPSPVDPLQALEDPVVSMMSKMTLEEKVGQLLMIDLATDGDIADAAVRDRIESRVRESAPGGVILFAGNPVSASLTVAWAQFVSETPLFVALDAEWGAGFRLQGLTRFPDAMAIAATGQRSNARISGARTAQEAAAAGINVLFAPTVDVNTNPANPVIGPRAWSDLPDSVSAYAGAFLQGVRSQRVLGVAKHFPGHGSTSRDSHYESPEAVRTDDALWSIDLAPYRALMADSLRAIMSAHVVPTGHAFQDSLTATFSRRILTDLARDSLGFTGLIFSDALNMAGAASIGTPAERSIRALEAGIDVLLMPPGAGTVKNAIVQAVRDGRISESRINASVERVLRAKEHLHLLNGSKSSQLPAHSSRNTSETPASKSKLSDLFQTLTSTSGPNEALWMGRDAVTLLRENALLPLTGASSILVISTDFRSAASSSNHSSDHFVDQLRERAGANVLHRKLNPRTWTASMSALVNESGPFHAVIVADYIGITPVFGWNREEFLRDLASSGTPLVHIGFSSPYVLDEIPDAVDVIIQSWDGSPAMAAATADALFGLSDISGRLPVHVSTRYPRGSGLVIPAALATTGDPIKAGFDSAFLDKLDDLLHQAVADSAFPAASLSVGRGLTVVRSSLFGTPTFERERPLEEQDLFDLASLTKVIATTTAVMLLVEDGKIDLDRPVADYLSEFGQNGKGGVTVRQLLTHTGGLIPFRPFHMQGVRSGAEVRRRILSDTLAYEPGSMSRYSDFGPITLAWMIERITGQPFGKYVRENVFDPLSMVNTGFLDARSPVKENTIPTEDDDYFRQRVVQGEVHDETAWLLGGTAGHAGLFSTAKDLSHFAGMLVQEGRMGERMFLRPETIRQFTTAVAPHGTHTRALGWDTKSMTGYSSAGRQFGPRSFGHTGFTGTSFWVDPDTHLFVILLTNRVYPTRENRKHVPVRPAVADAAFRAYAEGMSQRPLPSF